MSTGFLLIVGSIVLAVVVATFLSNRKEKNYGNNGVPFGMEAQYEQALAPGSDGIPFLYDLTTCSHCVRVHEFLLQHNIEHHDVSVDYFKGPARRAVLKKMSEFNSRNSFPTLVLPNGKVVIGFRESALREAFGLEPQ